MVTRRQRIAELGLVADTRRGPMFRNSPIKSHRKSLTLRHECSIIRTKVRYAGARITAGRRPVPMSRVTNKDAADVLFNVATILELAEDNPYRVRAYRRAARLLLSSRDDVRLKLTPENELDLPGLGPRLRRKLGELLSNGHMRFYVELCADLPGDVSTLMLIPGVGPKTALRLNEELGLTNAADVYAAAQQDRKSTRLNSSH